MRVCMYVCVLACVLARVLVCMFVCMFVCVFAGVRASICLQQQFMLKNQSRFEQLSIHIFGPTGGGRALSMPS